jgi:hypothetical protein
MADANSCEFKRMLLSEAAIAANDQLIFLLPSMYVSLPILIPNGRIKPAYVGPGVGMWGEQRLYSILPTLFGRSPKMRDVHFSRKLSCPLTCQHCIPR